MKGMKKMKTEEKIVDKVLDTLIDEASAEAYRKEADYNAPEVNFSPEHERNMQKLFKNERRKYNLRRAYSVAGKVACILLVVVVAMSVAIYSVEAWRTKFLNFFYDKEAPNTVIRFSETVHNSYSNDMVDIGYIPERFELVENQSWENNLFLTFANKEQYFQLKRNKIAIKTAINTEKGTLENLQINGYEGVFVIGSSMNTLLWYDGVYTYKITSVIEKDELIKIAESITAK